MMEWIAAAALAGGGIFLDFRARGRAHRHLVAQLGEAAERVGARTSAGTRFDGSELRAEVDGITVTLVVQKLQPGDRGQVVARADLADRDDTRRLYFGWDASSAAEALGHVPELKTAVSTRIDGEVLVRADDAELAERFARAAAVDLSDVRRAGDARGLEVTVRGGGLTLTVHDARASADLFERTLRAAGRLARLVSKSSTGAPKPKRPGVSVEPDARCALCSEHGDAPWVRCARCRAPHHRDCFQRAGGCVADGCIEVRSEPEAPARSS